MKYSTTSAAIFLSMLALNLTAQDDPGAQEEQTLPTTLVESTRPASTPPPAPRQVSPPLAAPVSVTPPVILNDRMPQVNSLTVPSISEAREALAQQPGGTSIIDAEDYKRGRSANLKDVLDFAPGVFVQPRFGAEEARLSIRGSGIQRTFHGRGLKLLQDGVPLNLADGGFDFQGVEPLAAQYIEIFRGANALEYGATTLGGAINFVSHTGHTAAPLQTRFEYGSFDTFRGQISAGIVSGNQDAYLSFTQSSTDGFRDHSRQESQRLFANLGIEASSNFESRLYLTYINTDSELPGNLTKQQLQDDPTQAARVPEFLRGFQPVARFDNITSDWRRDFELFRIANRTTWKGDEQSLSLGGFWAYKELDHPILFVIDQVSNDFGFNLRYDNEKDLFGRENHLVAGFSPTVGITDDRRYINNFGQRGVLFSDNHQTSVNVDLYAQNSHYFAPDIALVTGAQFSYASRENLDRFPVSAFDPDNSDKQDWATLSPKIGLLWDVGPEAQVFANISRSFEPPSFGELVNANNAGAGLIQLEDQTATTFEIGTRGRTASASWDIAYYYSQIDNELLAFEVQPGLSQTVNADRTIHQGVEAGVELELFSGILAKNYSNPVLSAGEATESKSPIESGTDQLVFRQNYLWNHFHFDDDATYGNNSLPGVPVHYYRAELLYQHPGGIYAGPNVEWVPESYNVDSAATEFADPYALLGFKVGYKSEKGFSMFVEGKNLTDKVYAATTGVVDTFAGQSLFLPGDGRSVYVGVGWEW